MTIHDLLPSGARPPVAEPRPRFNPQELLNALLGMRHRSRAQEAPRARIRMSVYRPNGKAAVAIRLGDASAN